METEEAQREEHERNRKTKRTRTYDVPRHAVIEALAAAFGEDEYPGSELVEARFTGGDHGGWDTLRLTFQDEEE